MTTSPTDQPFLTWADRNHLSYYYTQEYGIPENSLKLFLPQVTAYIHDGKLIRLSIDSDGELLDEMLMQLAQLFALCAKHDAYLDQAACVLARRR